MDEPLLQFSPHFAGEYHPENWPEDVFGTKAVGLAKVPSDWTPPFFVIGTDQHVDEIEAAVLEEAIQRISNAPSSQLIARSSAPHESLDDRGRFESYPCAANASEVVAAAAHIREHFNALLRRQEGVADANLAVVVQRYVSPTRFGHLSNERRVSHHITSWHAEHQQHESDSPQVNTFSVKGKTGNELTLLCGTVEELNQSLRMLARMYSQRNQRVHLEWVWDGHRLWIVQCDDEERFLGPAPGNNWLSRRPAVSLPSTHTLTPVLNAKRMWPKMQAVRTFHECGLPVAQVFVLENPEIIEALSRGDFDSRLREELRSLLELPILIRTDFSDQLSSSGLLLPRTGAISSVDEAGSFLITTASQICRDGVSPQEFCFTLHHFIGARACAFSYSKPGVSKVRIDSTWGGPDSLLCYPHDTFEVDVRDQKVTSKIRCKTHYLDMDQQGAWHEVRSGEPWDWKPSLSESELAQIADAAYKVSTHLKTPIEIMYFVGVKKDDTGTEICLPWFCTDKVASNVDRITGVRYAGRRVTVNALDDVKWIEANIQEQRLKRPFSIRLRPQPGLLRSEQFLNEIARVAKNADVPVELEGSILSHCYYVLRRLGVKVASVDAFKEPTKRQRFDKLVRDKIPLRIEAHGEKPRTLSVTSKELLHLLKAKAIEEAVELFWEIDNSRIIEELTDLLEVIESISRVCNTSFEQLLAAAAEKRNERGGFEGGVVLLETQSVPLITRELKTEGLFQDLDEEDGQLAPTQTTTATRIAQVLGSRRPKVEADGITVSLIPPDATSSGEDAVVLLPDGLHEVKIHYSGCKLRITIRPLTKRTYHPNQLRFAFPDGL
jgi:predicted house-cleaning noncanonical NTP pyrophosphatase (MazG superfamily)